ncbi:uncharacterized protein BO80DRAFT_411675 [Aspergillus ibericus CBS 121593]|uniref:BTB domain-containing protein n=1 Tax=Aspergillus ibericus CBS 121593 TaxID=1448316 RepID=A0A395GVB9_9EURO|nr:hypothetical protein BO80DRAFT_411675 [Aspergillus ibericus CBS 121593]RAK98958.1 hypothetical protein BO80DRAFT_411675 [Aspergillus ibericus CBS 121593]
MDENTTVIDPDGEVTIILKNPNAPFAVWDEDPEVEPSTPKNGEEETNEEHEQSGDIEPNGATPGDNKKSDGEKVIRVQVSAKHLMLPSPGLRRLITGGKEGRSPKKIRPKEIVTDRWNTKAFLLLLNILHCRHSEVPRKLSLDILARLAEIVDHYDCTEALGCYPEMWMNLLEAVRPTEYSRDLILWIWVSWVFHLPRQLAEATLIAIWESNGPVADLGLPIPTELIDHINKQRQAAISGLVSSLNALRHGLLCDSKGCSFDCRFMAIGILTKSMHQNSLSVDARIVAGQWSFHDLKFMVSSFSRQLEEHSRCQCQYTSWIKEVIGSAENSVTKELPADLWG